MIKFMDGTEISWEEAARMIEAEGRLITKFWCNSKNERCATGVIEDWFYGEFCVKSKGGFQTQLACQIQKANDEFAGTPEERAVYMAQWLRSQEGV